MNLIIISLSLEIRYSHNLIIVVIDIRSSTGLAAHIINKMSSSLVTSTFDDNSTVAGVDIESTIQRSFELKMFYIVAGAFGIPGNIMTIVVILR